MKDEENKSKCKYWEICHNHMNCRYCRTLNHEYCKELFEVKKE